MQLLFEEIAVIVLVFAMINNIWGYRWLWWIWNIKCLRFFFHCRLWKMRTPNYKWMHYLCVLACVCVCVLMFVFLCEYRRCLQRVECAAELTWTDANAIFVSSRAKMPTACGKASAGERACVGESKNKIIQRASVCVFVCVCARERMSVKSDASLRIASRCDETKK